MKIRLERWILIAYYSFIFLALTLHRVYGFNLAKSKKIRVPVVIYNGLNRQEESRIFIDINTKQRPVPNELLLDIKRLAEYETDSEQIILEVYDLFNERTDSLLLG
ncbi:MAG: hypothetical protein SWZ49_22325, partial [Cyanobacteriota bacterium]|nr:hypothetical protein [Cyanobacteriota bacterium]